VVWWLRVVSAKGAVPSASVPHTDISVWWQRFQDPLLNQLITQSLQANTSVQNAQAALRQARALRDVSAAALSPKINASASGQRSKSGDIAPANSFSTGFDASWEPDIFGANHQALAASEATARASAASLGDVQISVAAEVAVNYIQLRTTQVRLAIARANVASQAETLQITNWRVQAGLLTSLEGEQGALPANRRRHKFRYWKPRKRRICTASKCCAGRRRNLCVNNCRAALRRLATC
jgi:outer membrane protein TolC